MHRFYRWKVTYMSPHGRKTKRFFFQWSAYDFYLERWRDDPQLERIIG